MIEVTGKVTEPSVEDQGCAKIADLDDMVVHGADNAFFVRLQSWIDPPATEHKTMDWLVGKRVRITIDVIE